MVLTQKIIALKKETTTKNKSKKDWCHRKEQSIKQRRRERNLGNQVTSKSKKKA
jgi:hypothetical protein